MHLAPIVLFVYNRPRHTRRVVAALQQNDLARQSRLIVFSDSPRTPAEFDSVAEVRSFIQEVDGFKSLEMVAREQNLGLAHSIISGVTQVSEQYGRVIVLEDDLVTSPFFLRYMNQALDLYADEERVACIHGYIYPVKTPLPETFFIRGADCWGWGTWRRGWRLFEPDGKKLLDEIRRRKLAKQFDLNYCFTKMLAQQVAGENQSWAVRWYASAFLQEKLTLYPGRSLVHNIGFDVSGTHCHVTTAFDTSLTETPIRVEKIPIEENLRARKAITNYFQSIKDPFLQRISRKILSLLRIRKQ